MANANIVDITLRAQDQTKAAYQSAINSHKQLTAQNQILMKQMQQTGQSMSALGNLASAFGQTHMAGAAHQIQSVVMVSQQATSAFTSMSGALKRSIAGLALVGAAFAVAKFTETSEAATKAAEATKKAADMLDESRVATLKLYAASNAGEMEATLASKRRLEAIQELLDAGADANKIHELIDQEEIRRQKELSNTVITEAQRMHDFKTGLDRQYNEGKTSAYIQSLQTEQAAEMVAIEGRKQFLDVYRAHWMESHRNMFSYVAEGTQTIGHGLSNAISDVLFQTQKASAAFRGLGQSIAKMFADWLLNRSIAFAAEKLMASIGLGVAAAQQKAVTVIAAASAAAWAPAATASLIASWGASASAASLLAPLMAANSTAAAGLALAGGAAHGGLDYVPSESTFLLNKGERIIQPKQNVKLTSMLDDYEEGSPVGGRAIHLTINLDGRAIYKGVSDASRDGRLTINARAIV